jgi:hypothetical protein
MWLFGTTEFFCQFLHAVCTCMCTVGTVQYRRKLQNYHFSLSYTHSMTKVQVVGFHGNENVVFWYSVYITYGGYLN